MPETKRLILLETISTIKFSNIDGFSQQAAHPSEAGVTILSLEN